MPDSLPSLPLSLVDSYKQYKSDNENLATWLANIGGQCGYRLSISNQTTSQSADLSARKTTTRLKGKARKHAREAEANMQNPKIVAKTLPLKDYIPLARHIASFAKPPVAVPLSVIKKLGRGITLRHHCASWFSARVHGTVSLASNESHQHFIQVLEEVLKLLKPLCKPASRLGAQTGTASSDSKRAENDVPQLKLSNQFEALALDTVEEEEQEVENISQRKTSGGVGKKSAVARTIFVPEKQPQKDEFMLGCFCFFQDLQDVRAFLQGIWQKYKEKQIALITASLITTAALSFIRQAEEVFKTTFSQPGDYYDCFVNQMFRQACTAQGQPFVAKREFWGADGTMDATLPYVDDMADEADCIMLPTWHLLRGCSKMYLEDEEAALSDNYQAREIHLAHFWDTYKKDLPHAGRDGQNGVNSMLLSLVMITFNRQRGSIGVDIFRDGLAEMVATKVVPTWLVFATQNFLDVQHILMDKVCSGLQDFQSTCSIIRPRIRHMIEVLELNEVDRSKCNWLEGYEEVFFGSELQLFEPTFLMHPLGAGVREFFTVACFRRSGVECRTSADVVAMAHLYHAARLQGHCARWPDMDFVISTQTPEHIFLGGRPTTFRQSCLKVQLALGLSIRNDDTIFMFGDPIMRSGQGPRFLNADDTPFTNIFLTRGEGSQPRDIERTTENLLLVSNAALHGIDRSKFKVGDKGKLLSRAELLKLTSKKPKATFCQLLAVIEDHLVQEAPALCFDFDGFRHVCVRLLKAIHAQIAPAWSRAMGLDPFKEWTAPTHTIPMDLMAKAKLTMVGEQLARVPHFGARTFNEVATILEDFISENGSAATNELQRFAPGTVWASYQAQFGELASSQEQEPPTARPTLSSMTEEEIQRSGQFGEMMRRRGPTSMGPTPIALD